MALKHTTYPWPSQREFALTCPDLRLPFRGFPAFPWPGLPCPALPRPSLTCSCPGFSSPCPISTRPCPTPPHLAITGHPAWPAAAAGLPWPALPGPIHGHLHRHPGRRLPCLALPYVHPALPSSRAPSVLANGDCAGCFLSPASTGQWQLQAIGPGSGHGSGPTGRSELQPRLLLYIPEAAGSAWDAIAFLG